MRVFFVSVSTLISIYLELVDFGLGLLLMVVMFSGNWWLPRNFAVPLLSVNSRS